MGPDAEYYVFQLTLKKLILIPLMLLVLGTIVYYYTSFRNTSSSMFSPEPKTTLKLIEKRASNEVKDVGGHSEVYSLVLEYNPKTNVITEIKKQKRDGELTFLLNKEPSVSADQFTYKIEVLSKDNKLLQIGWNVSFKDLILTDKGTYEIGLNVAYQQDALIKLYLSGNKLIWSTTIQ